MGQFGSKPKNRQDRKNGRVKNHSQLRLMAAQQEITKAPRKPANKPLMPLTEAQRLYDAEIYAKDIVFGLGPAGTGKTWWAAMRAAQQLQAGEIERIIITRPAVEAGAGLGFLPGDLGEKYEPYLRPVKDALEEFFGTGHLEYLMKSGAIEARPLQFIRGSTIKDAWLIADEMQNATQADFKLLLTRIGENAKFLINGDPDQCDLPNPSQSGLTDAMHRLRHLSRSVGVVEFGYDDIVRSGLCREIVLAYSKNPNAHPQPDRYKEETIANDDSGLLRVLRVNNG